MSSDSNLHWGVPVVAIISGIGCFVYDINNDLVSTLAYFLVIFGFAGLLWWATRIDEIKSSKRELLVLKEPATKLVKDELEARIREAAQFKAELEAKRAEIAALKSGLNRSDSTELNEAIAQLYIGIEFERGRAEGEFAQVLAGLSESVDSLFAAAALVKGAPTPGERFVDQPAGSCKVFKTELTSDAALKGTIKVVRSPWVGFMANGKLKVINASNVSVYA